MFNFNSQKRCEKKFVEDYFISTSHLIDLVIDKWGDKYDIIKNDKEIFRYEYTILIFWFTIQKFANLFDDITQQNRLVDGFHNEYYDLLKKKLNMKFKDRQKIANDFNIRYRAYDVFLPLTEDKTQLLKLCTKFAEHIDSHHNTNYKDDLLKIMWILEMLVMFYFKSTEFATKKFIDENYKI